MNTPYPATLRPGASRKVTDHELASLERTREYRAHVSRLLAAGYRPDTADALARNTP